MRIFFGMVDFHSAVHAHWALLRLARASNLIEVDTSQATSRVTNSPLFQCEEILGQPDEFFPVDELPYGFAWFMLLYREWNRYEAEKPFLQLEEAINDLDHDLEGIWNSHTVNPQMTSGKPRVSRDHYLRETARLMSIKLHTHMSSQTAPCGVHHGSINSDSGYNNPAWSLVHWHGYIKTEMKISGADVNVLKSHLKTCESCIDYILEFLDKSDGPTMSLDDGSRDFFSVLGNVIYLGLTTGRLSTAKALEKLSPISLLLPIEPGHTPHRQAINFSRAWALKSIIDRLPSTRDRSDLESVYENHLEAALEDLEENKEDFGSTTHWVGQFGMFALTEGVSV